MTWLKVYTQPLIALWKLAHVNLDPLDTQEVYVKVAF